MILIRINKIPITKYNYNNIVINLKDIMNTAENHLEQGNIYREQDRDYQKAVEFYNHGLNMSSSAEPTTIAKLYYNKGFVYCHHIDFGSKHSFETATFCFEKGLNVIGTDQQIIDKLIEQVHFLLGHSHLDDFINIHKDPKYFHHYSEWVSAEEWLNEKNKNHIRYNSLKNAKEWLHEGQRYENHEKYDLAAKCYSEGLIYDCDDNLRGLIYLKKGQIHQYKINTKSESNFYIASECYSKAIKLNITNFETLNEIYCIAGSLHCSPDHFGFSRQLIDLEKGAFYRKKTLKNLPSVAKSHYDYAKTLILLGNYEEALISIDESLKLEQIAKSKVSKGLNKKLPTYEKLIHKSQCLIGLGKYREALELLNKALIKTEKISFKPGKDDERDPNIRILGWKAEALAKLGLKNEAIEVLSHLRRQLEAKKSRGTILHPELLGHIKKLTGPTLDQLKVLNHKEEQKKHSKHRHKTSYQDEDTTKIALEQLSSTLNRCYTVNTNNQTNNEVSKLVELISLIKSQQDQLAKQEERLNIQYEKLEMQEEKLKKQEEHLDRMNSSLIIAGVYYKAEIKKGFMDLENEHKSLFEYFKVFYWTILNYFDAYRQAQTSLENHNIQVVATNTQKYLLIGSDLFFGNNSIAQKIPIVGGLFSAINGAIKAITNNKLAKKFNDRVSAINQIIIFNNDSSAILQEDMSLCIAKASLEITKKKKNDILNPIKPNDNSKINELKKKVSSMIKSIKEGLLGPEKELYGSDAAILALQDATLLLAYLYQNSDSFIEDKAIPLHERFEYIVITGQYFSIINFNDKDEKTDNVKESHCCVFSCYENKYDNPLLNNVSIVNELSRRLYLPASLIVYRSHFLINYGKKEKLANLVNANQIDKLQELILNFSEN